MIPAFSVYLLARYSSRGVCSPWRLSALQQLHKMVDSTCQNPQQVVEQKSFHEICFGPEHGLQMILNVLSNFKFDFSFFGFNLY